MACHRNELYQHNRKICMKKFANDYLTVTNGKIKIHSYWNDCRNMVKSIRSDKQLREWQIVFESLENIIHNKYAE